MNPYTDLLFGNGLNDKLVLKDYMKAFGFEASNEKCPAERFRHHFLENGDILTIATRLYHSNREVKIGWAIFNPSDKKWIKKDSSSIARQRLEKKPLLMCLSNSEPILCDYLSLRSLLVILAGTHESTLNSNGLDDVNNLPDSTRQCILIECMRITEQLGKRFKINL